MANDAPSRSLHSTAASLRPNRGLPDALPTLGPPLLFAVRLWASVCLALFVAFWVQLDNPYWAGTTAAIVSQPQLGASLRKGWFRMIGTIVGAIVIVVLTGCFPQDRVAYLGMLALWCALCGFAATVLRNFASYAAALAGSTAAIIASANLGTTGGASPDVFLLAIRRASEICIGIACAGVVLAGTDLGGARQRLATSFADLTAEIAGRFTRLLALAGSQTPDTQSERRELLRRVVALEPAAEQTLGESSHVRFHALTLETAVYGLLRALDGWRGIATHLSRLPDPGNGQADRILARIPPELRSAQEPGTRARWMSDPMAARGACEEAARSVLTFPAGTPSLRLLADEAAKVLAGLMRALDGLALLVDAPTRSSGGGHGFRLGVPDWLPSFVNAARAFIAIAAVEAFWISTAWPSGASAIVFTAALVLTLSPMGDVAYSASIAVVLGTVCALFFAAIMKFAMLPAFDTFPALCCALGLFLIPSGFVMAGSRQPAAAAVFTAISLNFLPLLAPTNEMTYDTTQFYNSVLATVVGCGIVALVFALLPPLSPAVRTRRLLALALRDLRRLAVARGAPTSADWEGRMYGRLVALPDQADPLERARLLAALSVGNEIIHLHHFARRVGSASELDAALEAFARRNSAIAIGRLRQIDYDLACRTDAAHPTTAMLRARGRILIICEALSEHASYFDGAGA